MCQTCLQEWFRSSPSADDEMDDTDDPQSVLFRKKTCPCCRAVIRSRPIPLFLVKSIARAYTQAKATPGTAGSASPIPSDDPWEGIFGTAVQHDDDDEWSGDEDDEDDASLDDEEEEYDDPWPYDGYGTDPDDDRYEGAYIVPRWAPPSVFVPAEDEHGYALSDSELALLRRGCTQQMIGLFSMEYTHEGGIKAVLDDGNVVFLGWNVALNANDESGEDYMEWIAADIFDRPDRWQLEFYTHRRDQGWTAWKLVPEDEDEEFSMSDSDIWQADSWD